MADRWWCQWAWLGSDQWGDRAIPGVVLEARSGRLSEVMAGVAEPPPGAAVLPGLTVPALANAHSHCFHRALRARTHGGTGDFWTWRHTMYEVANRLDPESYHRLALGVFGEMALAGIGVVGEFHYLHHRPDGTPYDDPNAVGKALAAAATEVGIRITLLDTVYLHGGLGAGGYQPLQPEQQRFGDGSVERWLDRHRGWADPGPAVGTGGDPSPESLVRHGAALHSVRAVDIPAVAPVIGPRLRELGPLHVHVSEQPAENEACQTYWSRTPVELLADSGLLGPSTTIIHGTHVDRGDVARLGLSGTACCFCPTTERELADGIGPSAALAQAGVPLCLGSDSHAMIDLWEEARALELNQRLATLARGNHRPAELLQAATANGYAALGWPEGGVLAPGRLADFVTVSLDSVRTAGTPPGPDIVFSATAADVTQLVVAGRTVVADGRHRSIDVAQNLTAVLVDTLL